MIKDKLLRWVSLLDRLFKPFEVDSCSQGRFKGLLRLGLMLWLGISLIFAVKALNAAYHKDFWTDESFSYQHNITQQSVLDLIARGAKQEANSSPLDYVLLRIFYQMREKISILEKIPFNIYYRLGAIFASLWAGLLLSWLLYRQVLSQAKNYLVLIGQILLVAAALLFYYFWHENFHYSIEMRAYSLWNALWLMITVFFMVARRWNLSILLLLIALVMTSSGALFQLFSLAVSFLLVKIVYKDHFKENFKLTFKFFLLPVLIFAYYIFCNDINLSAGRYNQQLFNNYLNEFFQFWLNKEMVPILSVSGILMSIWSKRLQGLLIIFIAMLALYLMSPLINYLVISRGVFFSSRYYRYYDLIYPIFGVASALILPVLREWAEKLAKEYTRG